MSQDSISWRDEVSTRLNSYRARRRPRPPRYPSLTLKFERPEPPITPEWAEPIAVELPAAPEPQVKPEPVVFAPPDTAKIIEFPRLWEPPLRPADELADPVLHQPRILEVPEIAPPPPALGGMLIEAAAEQALNKLPGFDVPLQTAPMSQRAAASAIDAALVAIAFAVFATIFVKMVTTPPPLSAILSTSAVLIGLFWCAYQFLLLTYSGSTVGTTIAHLRLSRFDGSPVPRNLRRWRALASVLSGLSLGLGYAWCFLDEDALCWHDRITRTYLAPMPRR